MIKCLSEKYYNEIYNMVSNLYLSINKKYLLKKISDHLVYGLIIDNILIGIYCLKKHKKYLQIDSLYIKKPYRKLGYGRKLLKHAEKIAKKMKYKLLVVWTNEDFKKAYTFYSKCKYILVDIFDKTEFRFEKKLT